MKIAFILLASVPLLLIIFIFRNWFFSSPVIGGDWPYFQNEFIKSTSLLPPAWSATHGNGLGGQIISYSLDTYLYLTFLFTKYLSIPWLVVSKIFWFSFFLFISFFTSAYFIKRVIKNASFLILTICSLIYTTNTYILMIVGGGQMGVALAYAFTPLVYGLFLELLAVNDKFRINTPTVQIVILLALALAFQTLLDIRIAYITVFAAGITAIVFLMQKKISLFRIMLYGVIVVLLTFFLNLFWLLPMFAIDQPAVVNALGKNAISSVRFFSFANFSDTISLLHPNWPENIFGKVTFMRPEFLVIPLLAFAALFFLGDTKKKPIPLQTRIIILSLLTIAMLGAFLAKGANPPFENVYIWLFTTIPGFSFFRDSTKFYVLVALSYSVLLPFTLVKVAEYIAHKDSAYSIIKKVYASSYILLGAIFLIYWITLIYPSLDSKLSGTFAIRTIPQEYTTVNAMLTNEKAFSRSLWVPKQHRFTLATPTHPSVEALSFFNADNNKELMQHMKKNQTKDLLKKSAIKYVVIPYDPYGEIFIDDRKYSQKKRDTIEQFFDTIPWLRKVSDGKITVYQTRSLNDLFSLSGEGTLNYFPDGSFYKVVVDVDTPSDIVFSQNYSPNWMAVNSDSKIPSERTSENFMKFPIKRPGMYVFDVHYDGEKYYHLGKIISVTTIVVLLIGFLVLKLKKYEV